MKKDLSIGDEGNFHLVEGKNEYDLRYEMHKSRLTIFDYEGNIISIDKRKGRIVVDRHGTKVYWHREWDLKNEEEKYG